MICAQCKHHSSKHLGNIGMCRVKGCRCNMLRKPPPGPPKPEPPAVVTFVPVATGKAEERQETPQPKQPDLAPGRADRDFRPEHMMSSMTVTRHIPPEFLHALDAVLEAGLQKDGRQRNGWMGIPPAELHGKLKSLMGHAATGEFASAAANCLILWWHLERNGK